MQHARAKEIIAGLVSGEIDRVFETKGELRKATGTRIEALQGSICMTERKPNDTHSSRLSVPLIRVVSIRCLGMGLSVRVIEDH